MGRETLTVTDNRTGRTYEIPIRQGSIRATDLRQIKTSADDFGLLKLYPNVDFYSGLIYQAMGFPVEMFPVLFAIPRTAG